MEREARGVTRNKGKEPNLIINETRTLFVPHSFVFVLIKLVLFVLYLLVQLIITGIS